jgi:PncC family amidohydrolase
MKKEILDVVYKVHDLFTEKGLTLSVAESCTGGLISHFLTTVPGASMFFIGGIIAYSIEMKKEILGIPSEIISRHGMVSEETARKMAERVRGLTKADYSLSTTGNLGPDVLEGKEKGLVYTAVCKEGKIISSELRFQGDRELIKEKASLAALRLLVKFMELKENLYAGKNPR